MNINETIQSLQLLLNNTSDEGETEKQTYITDVKPSSTIFVLSTAIDWLQKIKIECEPVCHALWINGTFCSNCKRFPVDVSVSISNQELTKYFSRCPHCGARMDAQYVDTDII